MQAAASKFLGASTVKLTWEWRRSAKPIAVFTYPTLTRWKSKIRTQMAFFSRRLSRGILQSMESRLWREEINYRCGAVLTCSVISTNWRDWSTAMAPFLMYPLALKLLSTAAQSLVWMATCLQALQSFSHLLFSDKERQCELASNNQSKIELKVYR